jgi:aspartyl-tRNA(Asn)/glutamyl-tRNA(Gln) amidotransferase subunit C
MEIGSDDVKRIAHLARLTIVEKDVPLYAQNLTNILGFVEQMSTVDTAQVQPMAHPQDAVQRLRPDVVTEPDQRSELIKNAPLAEDGMFLVPRVIE